MPNLLLHRGRKTYGPFDAEQIRRLYERGKLKATDQAWTEGFHDWASVAQVLAAIEAAPSDPAVAAPFTGREPRRAPTRWSRAAFFALAVGVAAAALVPAAEESNLATVERARLRAPASEPSLVVARLEEPTR